MATKKKATVVTKKPRQVKARATKAPKRARVDSLAVKVLGQLPALDSRLRMAFRLGYSDEQCEAWGTRTKATDVLREASGWVTALHGALRQQTVAGYSQRRLAFLCELLIELEDEIAATTANADGEAQRGARQSALSLASRVRLDLAQRLTVVAAGREELLAAVAEREASGPSMGAVRDSLAGLIDLATKWRRDPVLQLLADDADLTVERLTAAFNAQESLGRVDEALRPAVASEGDAVSVNLIEGRILRELQLAQKAFASARDAGVDVPALVSGPTLRRGFAQP